MRTSSNHSSDIDVKDFVKKFLQLLPYSFLVIDTTHVSDNPLRFRKNLFEKIYKLIMTIDDKIRDEKLQYSIYR